MPYNSDDTDTDTDTDEDVNTSREDPRYAIIRAAGPSLSTSSQQLKYMENALGTEYTPNIKQPDVSYLNPRKTTITNLFCVKSSVRDKSIFPSPYNFQIKLPRVYKNITKFQIIQISFPYNIQDIKSNVSITSSFSSILASEGYTSSCISSCINIFTNSGTKSNTVAILEQGRLINGSQMITTLDIPEGKFNNDQIAAQLTVEANNTPPFNLISYEDFKNIFKITKDVSILFNEPGDNYHSKLLINKYKHHNKEIIMNTYYSQHDIDRHPIITDIIAFNAYYYPILKELVNTEFGSYFISIDNRDKLKYDVLHNFLGLDSIIYYEICLDNKSILDEFRKNFTFQHRNVNKYNWSYDNGLKRFNCAHDTLHTSLKNDINQSLQKYLSEDLQNHSLHHDTFQSLKVTNANNNMIFDHLNSNLSTIITSYFLENGYQYNGGNDYSTIDNVHSFSDLHNDSNFTNIFNYKSTFGGQYGTYSGKNMSFSNFMDYHSTISSYSNIIESTSNTFSTIYGNIYNKHHTYISSKYTNVLSNDMIQNKTYIKSQSLPVAFTSKLLNVPGMAYNETIEDPCVSTCYNIVNNILKQYYSCLPVNNVINTLTYKLGINNITNINFNNITTFLNTVSNNHFDFFLQVNPEQSFNNIDIGMPENYNISNQTTGQTKLMYAKILTGGLGSSEVTQTCIQNPIIFTNTLGKLDKLTFKIYLDNNELTPMWLFYPFVEQRDEWSATFQIDEEVGFADRNNGFGQNPTIPIPDNLTSFSYMGVT